MVDIIRPSFVNALPHRLKRINWFITKTDLHSFPYKGAITVMTDHPPIRACQTDEQSTPCLVDRGIRRIEIETFFEIQKGKINVPLDHIYNCPVVVRFYRIGV